MLLLIFCNHLAKLLQKIITLCSPNEDFGWPNERLERIFEVLFKGVSTRLGLRSFERYLENAFPNVHSAIQNLRLGSINFLENKCCDYLLYHLAKLLQKIIASQKTKAATIFCNYLAKLLHKIITS